MIKPKWTVAKPPRVHELSVMVGTRNSKITIDDIHYATGFRAATAATKVPLPVAFAFLASK